MRTKHLVALLSVALLAAVLPGGVSAQSDLDAFMERVLARRDDNWKKLQQYVLEEKEAFDLTGPGGLPLWGMRREYSWFIRQGIFVRSPVKANGVALSDADRRKAEEEWLRRETTREERRKRRAEREKQGLPPEPENRAVVVSPTGVQVIDETPTTPADLPSNVDDLLKQGADPQFVSSAYFLRFRFEKGHYALAGREKIDGQDALKIEYYPEAGLFKDGRTKPDKKVRDKEAEIEAKMNKASLVTLWVDPKTHQILQYTFDDIDMDIFPGRSLVRVSDLKATMRMSQAFPDVWLPRSIQMNFGMMMAVGAVDTTYKVDYINYKQADVTYKIKMRPEAWGSGLDGKGLRLAAWAACVTAAMLVLGSTSEAQTSPGVVAEVRVHGNHTTPNADVLALIGDVVGQPATDALVAEITTRLEKSGRFEGVEVRKRFRSIENPDDILLVVVIDEMPGVSDDDLTPGPMKKLRSSGMFLPIFHSDDGYGLTYGMRMSFVNRLGPKSRITFPLSWGGERQARMQVERAFASGPVNRVAGEGGIRRRENPHFEIGDTRTFVQGRIESSVRRWLRAGAGAGVEDVEFGDVTDRLTRAEGDVTLDTRVDPAFPRNAVHATFGLEHLSFEAGDANRRTADVRGYLGLFGQSVLALRAMTQTATSPLPEYEKALLGGADTVRGYDVGYRVDDNIAALSAEVRLPITSPMSVGRFGIKIFADAGTSYPFGSKLTDQQLDLGYGAGAYLHLTIISLSLDVARGRETGDYRWHFGMGVTFK